jgi:hypothetical protein
MALEGSLQDMSLSDLFQVFRLGPKSGVLLLSHDAERGVIYVDRGALIDAFVVRGEERSVVATSDEAVLHMLGWDDAQFVFRHDLSVAGRTVQVQHDSDWLVMEGMRRRTDPLRALPYHNLRLDTRLQLSPLPSNAESSVSLDVNQWRILSHAANNQNLRTICELTGIEPDTALRITAELLAIGLVEAMPTAPTRPTTAATSAARQQEASRSTPGQEQPAVEQAPPPNGKDKQPARVGRSLLNAILRRVSEL